MEANELRIGNLVKRLGKTTIIKSINIDEFNEYYISNSNFDQLKVNQIEPIELDDIWLLLFGFDEVFHKTYQMIDSPFDYLHSIYFEFRSEYFGENDDFICGDYDQCIHINMPKYVHELQNLYFALTRTELILKG